MEQTLNGAGVTESRKALDDGLVRWREQARLTPHVMGIWISQQDPANPAAYQRFAVGAPQKPVDVDAPV